MKRHALFCVLAAAACSAEVDVDSHQAASEVPDVPHQLDVLVVVDDSGSMAEEQASLAANFQLIVDELESLPGGLPDLHIGIVSTDMGAGPYNIQGCDGVGDAGVLQHAGCQVVSGAFIDDAPLADGTRDVNYTGTLSEAFSCMGALGTAGCGFEQPLESMRAALDGNPGNANFLRPEAALAIIVIADEDDCSAVSTDVFDTSDVSIDSELGPLSSFRCVEFGLTCDGGPVARTPGSYASCEPQAGSPYLAHPDEFVDFLTALKGNPNRVIVSVIAGDRGPLDVGTGFSGNPEAQPACTSASGSANAGYRLGYFSDQFIHGLFTSICNPDLSGALQATAALISNALQNPDDGPNDPPDPGDDPDTAGGGGCSTTGGGGTGLWLALLALVAAVRLYHGDHAKRVCRRRLRR